MFYSHTFLARKGPLGTVWCAAHLQHKLKKSHYTSTDIPSTVERIMFPELPIALRMSSHLLLGVVRIYSKKVDYLHHDCNSLWVSLRNAFRPVDVNLVENASHSQFNAVTLPETYQLDALDIDLTYDGSQDTHLKSHQEITLTDQYSSGELYVRITFNDDITPDLSHSETSPHRDVDPMQIDNPHQEPVTGDLGDGDGEAGPTQQREDIQGRFEDGSSLPDIPDEFEVMRDYRGNDTPIMPMEDEILPPEPNTSPQKNTPEKEVDTPPLEHILAPQVQSPQLSQRSGPSSPPNNGASAAVDSFVNVTPPDLSLRPSPPPDRPQRRQRKRKQFFDESLVLTNEFLKNALNNPSDLVEKRRKLPSSDLDMWRFRNRKKKEHIFFESLTSGLCAELQIFSRKDSISVKTHQILSEDAEPATRAADSPATIPNEDMEIERLRSRDQDPGVHNLMHELMPSPPQFTPQRSRGSAQTSSSPLVLGSVSEPRFGTGLDSGSEPRFGKTIDSESDRGMFTGSIGLGMEETPFSDFELRMDGSNAGLSDIPELRASAELDELSFLEQDNNSQPGSQGPRESDPMSVRTRAVAQYLKNHSPLSKYSGSPTEELSLNHILEGRSRKLCARMFYETLVLKDYGLIDVKQDEPYGDITLKLTPTLSMAKI